MPETEPHNTSKLTDEGQMSNDAEAPAASSRSLPLPSDNPVTNLLIADIVLRGVSTLLRKNVEKEVVKASTQSQEQAEDVLDGRTLITTLGLYGASKLATRSLPGLAVVTGALVLKTLYDRGKTAQRRVRNDEISRIHGDQA